MRNSIYEIAHSPIPMERRARAGNMPDWFYEQVCDYAVNHGPLEREASIRELSGLLGYPCKANEADKLILPPQIKLSFFRQRFACFKTAAAALAQTDYAAFAGLAPSASLSSTLARLSRSYENRRGIYIYSAETGALVTLDYWLRNADFSHPFYIGGIIDYYC